MRRRDFVTLVSGAAVAWPLTARAQQPGMRVLGWLAAPSAAPYARFTAAFRDGLKAAGYIEGQNVAIEYRWAEGQYGRLPELAIDLVRRGVVVLVATGGEPSALAAKA